MSIKRLHEERAFIPEKMKVLLSKTYSQIIRKEEKYLSFLGLPYDEEALSDFFIVPDEPKAIATREKYIQDRIFDRITIDNVPYFGLKIIGLTAQGMTVDYQGLRWDLNLEVSEDVLLHASISSDNEIQCNFLWYVEESFSNKDDVYYRCELIRENSPLHLAIVKLEEQRKVKHISFDEMEFGKVYETNLGETFAYLGKVISTPITHTSKPSELDFNPGNPIERHLLVNLKGQCPKEFKIHKRIDFDFLVWDTHPIFYSAIFIKPGVEIKIKPSIIDDLREIAREQAKKAILEISRGKYRVERKISSNYSFLNMHRASDPVIQNFNIRGYLSLL